MRDNLRGVVDGMVGDESLKPYVRPIRDLLNTIVAILRRKDRVRLGGGLRFLLKGDGESHRRDGKEIGNEGRRESGRTNRLKDRPGYW